MVNLKAKAKVNVKNGTRKNSSKTFDLNLMFDEAISEAFWELTFGEMSMTNETNIVGDNDHSKYYDVRTNKAKVNVKKMNMNKVKVNVKNMNMN